MWIVGLSRFVIVFCVTPFVTRRARTAAGRRGSGRSRSRRTCSRSGRSARRAGPNAAGVLVILSKHTFYIRFHLSLCQRNCEQVRLVHLIVIAVPVPQIQEHIVDVIKVVLEEWMSKRIVQQIVDVPVPQILEEIVALVAGEVVCNARTGVRPQHGWTCTCREADRGRSGTTDPGEHC